MGGEWEESTAGVSRDGDTLRRNKNPKKTVGGERGGWELGRRRVEEENNTGQIKMEEK